MPESGETAFVGAVNVLVEELRRESASGLITRKALIALDRVQQLLDLMPVDGAAPVAQPLQAAQYQMLINTF